MPEGDDDDDDDDEESTTDEDDYGDEEREMVIRREALRQRGRESYAKRKESSITSTNTTPVSTHSTLRAGDDRLNGIEQDGDDDDEDVFFNESRTQSRTNGEKKPPRKKRKSGAGDLAYHPSDDGSGTDEEEGYHTQEPGSGKRRVSSNRRPGGSPRVLVASTPPQGTKRMDSTSTANTVVSRFKEGSMRDRASAVPPQEIVGMLPNSSPARPEEEATMAMTTSGSGLSNMASFGSSNAPGVAPVGGFTLGGLTSLIPFNPLRIVKDIKESWDRQKRLYEAKERKKKLMRERKKKGQRAYEEFKRLGELQGYTGNAAAIMGANMRRNSLGSVRADYMQDPTMGNMYGQDIGRAFSTDETRPVSRASVGQGGSLDLGRRRAAVVASFAGDVNMRGMGDSFGLEGHQGDGEIYQQEQNQDAAQRASVDSAVSTTAPPENFSRRSTSKLKEMAPPTRAPPPPPPPPPQSAKATNGGKFGEVKTLVKKKSKVFAATFASRSEDSKPSSKAAGKEGPKKSDIRRQERLQKKVSNLEEQLDKAKRELVGAIDITSNAPPPASRVSRRKKIAPINAVRESVAVMSGDETDEGEKTEVDEDPTAPLSPAMNASFGGSFMAKTADMTIMESLNETEHENLEPGRENGNGRALSSVYGMILPKRVSKSNLGAAGRRRRVSVGSGNPSNSASELKHQGSLPAISSGGKNNSPPSDAEKEEVPAVPRFPGTNGK